MVGHGGLRRLQILRKNSICLILAMAVAGARPLGQVRVQLSMVWQRYTLNGSSSSSRRSPVASSRLSGPSRVGKGKRWPAPEDAKNPLTLSIYRYEPGIDEHPRLDHYTIDVDKCGPMLLDALIYIKNHIRSEERRVGTECRSRMTSGAMDE